MLSHIYFFVMSSIICCLTLLMLCYYSVHGASSANKTPDVIAFSWPISSYRPCNTAPRYRYCSTTSAATRKTRSNSRCWRNHWKNWRSQSVSACSTIRDHVGWTSEARLFIYLKIQESRIWSKNVARDATVTVWKNTFRKLKICTPNIIRSVY